MSRILSFIAVIFFVCYGQALAADSDAACVFKTHDSGASQMYMPFPAALRHGINLSHWWEDVQDRPLSADDIHTIHNMGFDFVRLPISPVWLEMDDHAERAKKLGQLRCDIISLLNEGLTVIIDMHPSQDFQVRLFHRQEEVIPRMEKIWNQMEPVLADLPSWRIYLELLNEPMIESVSWWRMQEKIIDDLRPTFSGNTFIASSGPFNGWWDLVDRTAYKDPNVVYDFHFYEPVIFTRRGAPTASSPKPDKPPSPLVYPVDKSFNFDMKDPEVQKYVGQSWNASALSVILKDVVAWRDHYEVVVVCLEYGVYRSPSIDDRSRNNWLKDTHEALDNLNIPWSLWEYRGPYGLMDAQGNLDKAMVNSLGLKRAGVP